VAKVTMPQLGESVAEGTIGKWLKQPGDHVAKYEPLLEVITDKVNAEVPSPFEGVLKEILVEEGATVPNNAEIAVIEEAGAGAGAGAADAKPAEAKPTEAKPGEAKPGEAKTADASSRAEAKGAEPAAVSESKSAADSGQPVATSPASATPTPAAAAAPDEAREPETNAPASSPMSASGAAVAHGPAGSDEGGAHEVSGNADARMTPAVRRLLREHGLQAAMIVGTGGGGRITREDVTDFVESQRTGQPVGKQNAATRAAVPAAATAGAAAPAAATATPAPVGPGKEPLAPPAARGPAPATQPSPAITFPEGADEVLVPMTQMRKGIAAQMTRALQVPHAYVQMEVDLSNLVKFREREKKGYQSREGLPLSYVPFVVKASAEALKRNPTFNAHWTEQGLLAKRRINIGIAVALDDGLIVPVLRDVDTLSIHGLNRTIAEVSDRMRAGKFQLDDFGGGTFTVDNTGWLGTNMVMPIINVPEVGIVTMDRITKRPVVIETPDGDTIGIRSVMNMVLGVDHRANDGAGGAALLRDIKAWLEAVGPETPIY
jgi:pyruvate/2-oxoglutarate dehydrogenase complex dihydrolipoamide acyltransferase (E2) component